MTSFHLMFPVLGIIGLVFAGLIYVSIKRIKVANELMVELSDAIHSGAMVFLRREYTILVVFVLAVTALLALGISPWTAVAFLLGAASSMMAGFFGMKAATHANVRTTAAANDSGIAAALTVAFNGGAVMGLSVASLGLIGVSAAYTFFLRGTIEASDISGFCHGSELDCPVCPCRWRHLYKVGGCRCGSGGQGRSRDPGR
jgi:K(+)-stimulated pyrophosphate-energized sodium pump